MSKLNDTTIRISIGNRKRLATVGRKDETFDEIVSKLLDVNEIKLFNEEGKMHV